MEPDLTHPKLSGKRDSSGPYGPKWDVRHPSKHPPDASHRTHKRLYRSASADDARVHGASWIKRGGGGGGGGGERCWLLPQASEKESTGRLAAALGHRRPRDALLVTQSPIEGVNYEGLLRFYHLRGGRLATKAVWLTDRTTINDLMTTVQEKFGISDTRRQKTAIYQVRNQDEICLGGEERPLEIAVTSEHGVRFVLRMEPCVTVSLSDAQLQPPPEALSGQRKSLTHFFGVASGDLSVPYYAGPTPASPGTKAKLLGSPTRSKKHPPTDSLSLSSNGSGGGGTNGTPPGLVLKHQTFKFIKRFQSSEGHAKGLGKKDRGSNGSPKSLDPMKRLRAKSLSVLFDRGQAPACPKEVALALLKESQSEDPSPGLLKVFGDQVCPNATYKSVLASAQSSAIELVKVVLERFSLPVGTFADYALCDVIGNYKANPEKVSRVLGFADDFEEKQEWTTECMRVLADDERPLAVKSFWKPQVGFERRFELWRRTDIAATEVDTITHGININAKRLQAPKGLRGAADLGLASLQEHTAEAEAFSPETEIAADGPQLAAGPAESEIGGSRSCPPFSLLPPRDSPYLLTLHGNSPDKDQVLYLLDADVSHVGHSLGASVTVDIRLDSADINRDHCHIVKRQYLQSLGGGAGSELDSDPDDLFLEPIGEAKVAVNGCLISQPVRLSPGDLISLGDHYLFLLKDPLAPAVSICGLERLLTSPLGDASSGQPAAGREGGPHQALTNPRLAAKAGEYSTDARRPKLWYPLRREDDVLKMMASLLPASLGAGEAGPLSSLSLSYMACMCVEHSAYHFHEEKAKQLMLKVATMLQMLAWDKTKETPGSKQEKSVSVQTALAELLPDLRVVVGLLSNALEILHFLRSNMADYVTEDERREAGEEAGVGGAYGMEEEALVELEEVVMYAFQQMVYYLTKTLYTAIPDVLDSNPFADDRGDSAAGEVGDLRAQGMDAVLAVFQTTSDLLRDLAVPPAVGSQLFADLLFFTNASLFNLLIERGASGKFYKWAKGVQMRGNLDSLESWLQAHQLQGQAARFLARVSPAINLLATPKVQLLQADWKTLRSDFPGLTAAQLHYLLCNYHLGPNQPLPTAWTPPAEEMEAATCPENILASFDNHPDLVLPSEGFRLDLRSPITDNGLVEQLQELKKRLPYISYSTGCTESLTSAVEQSPSDASVVLPVPPPRTNKSHRGPADPSTEPLERPLEVRAAAPVPVAMANTLRLQQTSPTKFLLPAGKMSPRVYAGPNPPPLMGKTGVADQDPAVGDRDPGSSAGGDRQDPHRSLPNGRSGIGLESSPSMGPGPAGAHQSGQTGDGCRTAAADHTAQNGAHTSTSSTEEPKKPCPTLAPCMRPRAPPVIVVETSQETVGPTQLPSHSDDANADVFAVDLEKGEEGVGLGLIDGMHTSLRSPGIYVRRLLPGGSAMVDGRLSIGDRILAVNGTSLVGADYNSAMQLIRTSGINLRFLVAKTEPSVALKITAAT